MQSTVKSRHIWILYILLMGYVLPIYGSDVPLKNGRIDKCYFEGGFARAMETSATTDRFVFYYYNQDHLGNNREVVDIKGRIHQVTNYYPFGAPHADATAMKGVARLSGYTLASHRDLLTHQQRHWSGYRLQVLNSTFHTYRPECRCTKG